MRNAKLLHQFTLPVEPDSLANAYLVIFICKKYHITATFIARIIPQFCILPLECYFKSVKVVLIADI